MSAPPDCQACPYSCCNYFSQCPDTQSPDPLISKCWTSQFSSNSPTADNTQNAVATTAANDTGNGNNPLLSSDSEHNDGSNNNNNSNQNNNSNSDGANVGLIVGVSVAVFIGLLLIILIIYCCKCCCWNSRYNVNFQGNISNYELRYQHGRQTGNQYPPPYPNPHLHLDPYNPNNNRYAQQHGTQNAIPPYFDNSQGVITSNVKSKSTNKYKPSSRDTVV